MSIKPPMPRASQWTMRYGEYDQNSIKVKVIDKDYGRITFQRFFTNDDEHYRAVTLTWWDKFWYNKTLEQKLEEEAFKVRDFIERFNQAWIDNKLKSKEITERVNIQI